MRRLVVPVGLLAAVTAGWLVDPAPGSPALAVRYFASAAEPLGLVITDASAHELVRLDMEDGITQILRGPGGRCAVVAGGVVSVFRETKRLRKASFAENDVRVLSWVGQRLLLRRTRWSAGGEQTDFYDILDVESGEAKAWPGPAIEHAVDTPAGLLATRLEGRQTVATLYDGGLRPVRSWQMAQGAFLRPWCLGGRFVVGATEDDRALGLLDLQKGTVDRLALGNRVRGTCQGRAPSEVIMVVPVAVSAKEGVLACQIVALDVVTRQERYLARLAGSFALQGLTDDGRWLLGLVSEEEAGPARLEALSIADGTVRTVQLNIYECAVIRTDP